MKGNGLRVNSMGKENMYYPMENKRWGIGNMEREVNGQAVVNENLLSFLFDYISIHN